MTGPWWAVAVGALVGAPCRYLLDTAVSARLGRSWPWGTLAVNLLGSAAAGLLAGLVVSGRVGTGLATLLGVGVLGSFTTASTFAVEVVGLGSDGRRRDAAAVVVLSVGLGVLLAYAGYWTAAQWSSGAGS